MEKSCCNRYPFKRSIPLKGETMRDLLIFLTSAFGYTILTVVGIKLAAELSTYKRSK